MCNVKYLQYLYMFCTVPDTIFQSLQYEIETIKAKIGAEREKIRVSTDVPGAPANPCAGQDPAAGGRGPECDVHRPAQHQD